MKKTLIIGYGNRDREDDGAGWHMLSSIAQAFNLPIPELPGDWIRSTETSLELLYLFQLLPEMAEDLASYEVVIFLDAHNSNQLDEVVFEPVIPNISHSAFTHHLSPERLLSIAQIIGKPLPEAWIVSVRGHSFRFTNQLSPKTSASVVLAVKRVLKLLSSNHLPTTLN